MNKLKQFVARWALKGMSNPQHLYEYGLSPVWIGDDISSFIDKGYMYNANVYAVISYIIKKCHSGIKLKLVKIVQGETIEIESHPLLDLLESPNENDTYIDFIEQVIGYKLITGRSYIYMPLLENGINAGRPAKLWCIPTQLIRPVRTQLLMPISQYQLSYNQAIIPADEIIDMRYFNPRTMIGEIPEGLSPISAGARVITRNNANYEATVAAFQNMGARGIISREGEYDDMTEEQAKQVDEKYTERYGGVWKNGKVIVTSAKLKWQQIGLSPVDLNILEDMKWGIRDISNLYGLDSSLFNDPENKTYNNKREAKTAAYTDAIIPEMESFATMLNRWLVPLFARGEKLKIYFDYSDVPELQENKKELVLWLRDAFWIKGIDKQRLMGMPQDPVMDKYFIPNNMIGVDEMDMPSPEDEDKMLEDINDYQ